jgi:hypothetical protein
MVDETSLREAVHIRRLFQSIFSTRENGFASPADYFVGRFQRSTSRVRDFAAVL